jgi:hypothetical protein
MSRCYVRVELESSFIVEDSFVAGEGERCKGGDKLGLGKASR